MADVSKKMQETKQRIARREPRRNASLVTYLDTKGQSRSADARDKTRGETRHTRTRKAMVLRVCVRATPTLVGSNAQHVSCRVVSNVSGRRRPTELVDRLTDQRRAVMSEATRGRFKSDRTGDEGAKTPCVEFQRDEKLGARPDCLLAVCREIDREREREAADWEMGTVLSRRRF